MAGLAGLTHFYGLFLVLAAAAWDGWRRRWSLSAAALIGALPALAWMAYAADYLFSSRAGSWIGVPDYALLEETLARGLGLWPLPKVGSDSAVAGAVAALGRAASVAVAGWESARSKRSDPRPC